MSGWIVAAVRGLVELLGLAWAYGLGVGVSPPLPSPLLRLRSPVKLRPWSSVGLAYVIGSSGCVPWPRPTLAVLDFPPIYAAPLPPEHIRTGVLSGGGIPNPAMNTPF